jgi:hypothetical protein
MSVSAANGAGSAAMVTRDQMAAMLAARPAVANQAEQAAAITTQEDGAKPVSSEGNQVDLYL